MKITDIRIRIMDNGNYNKRKAVASVTFDNEFVVHNINVIESDKGLFISMPSVKTPNGEYRDIAHPINAECRQKIQEAVLNEYKTQVK